MQLYRWLLCALLGTGLAVQAAPQVTTSTAAAAKATTRTAEHGASIPTLRTNAKERFLELHNKYVARAKQGNIDVLFMGDSITERWTSSPRVWEKYYGKMKAANFGVGGDRTQHVLWRITNGEYEGISPKVVVLLIGTNNANSDAPEPIAKAIEKIVTITRQKLPKTKVLLLGIFPRRARTGPNAERPVETVGKVNPLIAKLDDGKMVRFLDLTPKFLVNGQVPPDIMPDGVHLSAKGYDIWAKNMQPLLKEMMK